MSLFPAYASETQSAKEPEDKINPENWLTNSSFKVDVQVLHNTANPINEEITVHSDQPVPKHRKLKRKKTKVQEKLEPPDDNVHKDFVIDVKWNKEFLSVKTISRPSAPRYNIAYYINAGHKSRKRKFKRYYKTKFQKHDDKSNSEEEQILTMKNIQTDKLKSQDNTNVMKEEESLSQTTAFYNKSLAENPNDVKLWIKYIEFQDSLYQFEKIYKKGSIAKAQRVLAERKLCIIDKALTHNPNSEILLRERLNVAVTTYPADELQVQLRNLVEKDQGNIIFWQGYIEATQCSMSHCSTPAVLNLYNKCLSVLHKLRRNTSLDKPVLEESILRMLYQCGLFLKQAGLFEQLWTLLRLYLELNLSPTDKTKFNIGSRFKEQQLLDLEEVVFSSQLPLHELWLRTEKLRESCHWLPHLDDTDCEDPQRIVFVEDVNELIHPITMPNNIFKMTATILTLLKVPLLPCRHTTMQDLGLDYVPWALDSIESLLPIYMPLYGVETLDISFLNDNRLAVGPQYLKVLPGQDEYLEFILVTMKNCADCLTGDDKVAVTVWWFRFQRLLLILNRVGQFKMSQSLKKKIKANIKDLLKQDENRNNQIYYCEYALMEYELGSAAKAISVIQSAMLLNKVEQICLEDPPGFQCYLLRHLVEQLVKTDKENSRQKAVIALCKFVLQRNIECVDNDTIKEASSRFKIITLQLMNKNFEKKHPVQNFLPDFFTDWIICQGWFNYLTSGPIESGSFIENSLIKLNEIDDSNLSWHKEVLFEFYVAMLFKHSTENSGSGTYKILDSVLHRAVESYPNNLFFMGVLAKEQLLVKAMGHQWWKVETLLLKTGRALPILIAILVPLQQFLEIQDTILDTITGEKIDLTLNFKNKMLSLFRKVTKSSMCSRRCGLVWRLFLQFVHTYFDLKLCRNVYYSAVEECPWLKALYIDAAIYIPAELPQIQDLIIEKQLRLHVTPEELDVLRS